MPVGGPGAPQGSTRAPKAWIQLVHTIHYRIPNELRRSRRARAGIRRVRVRRG